MLTGERPEVNAGGGRAAARATGTRTSPPTSCGSASGRSSAGCCRTPTSACSTRDDLARLREVTASQGLMLESVNPAPGDGPRRARRPSTRPAAGDDRRRRRAADPVHQRDPRRDRRDRGRAHRGARGARRAPRAPRPHPGGDPAELRPPRDLLRARAGRDRRRGRAASTGARVSAHRPAHDAPGLGLRGDDRGHEAADRRDPPAHARGRHPGAAEPVGLVAELVARRGDRPRRAVAPTATTSRPSIRSRRRRRSASGCRPRASRSPSGCASTPSTSTRSGSPRRARRDQAPVLVVHPPPRLGPPGGGRRSPTVSRRGRSSGAGRAAR